MELILLIGIQASGKSTFCREKLFRTHVRLNLDMLETRRREGLLVEACLASKAKFVIDNTNLTSDIRARFIGPAKAAGFEVVGYYFPCEIDDALRRNEDRPEGEDVPEIAIINASSHLEQPKRAEGFDKLFEVRLEKENQFSVRKLKHIRKNRSGREA